MKIHGEHRFHASQEEVWAALLDPEVLSRTVPGSEGLEQTGENDYRGKLKMKIGPVQGIFEGRVRLSELQRPTSYKIAIDGQGAAGFMSGVGAISLSAVDGDTLLTYEVDAQVGGRIASVGQRLVESSAKVITRQALQALEAQIETRVGEVAAPGPAAPMPAAPSQAKMATGLATGLLGELIPTGAGRWALLIGVALLVLFLVSVLRGGV